MKASLITLALVLTACGTDGPENNDPKPVTASAVLGSQLHPEFVVLDLTSEVEGCEFTVSRHNMDLRPTLFSNGEGRVLPYVGNINNQGPRYQDTEGHVTRWVQIYEETGAIQVGISCYRPEEFR